MGLPDGFLPWVLCLFFPGVSSFLTFVGSPVFPLTRQKTCFCWGPDFSQVSEGAILVSGLKGNQKDNHTVFGVLTNTQYHICSLRFSCRSCCSKTKGQPDKTRWLPAIPLALDPLKVVQSFSRSENGEPGTWCPFRASCPCLHLLKSRYYYCFLVLIFQRESISLDRGSHVGRTLRRIRSFYYPLVLKGNDFAGHGFSQVPQ